MSEHASYIFSAYSYIRSLPLEKLLQVGDLSVEGTPIPSFDEGLLINLCEEAQKIFEKEENVINVDGDVVVVGDIHGSFHDLLRILNYVESSNSKVIFLGDYVDRGYFSLECITLLFALKLSRPDRYFLLRGNHEFDDMCSCYGFKKEILNFHDTQMIEEKTKHHSRNKKLKDENPESNSDQKSIDEDPSNHKTYEQEEKSSSNNYFANHININCYKYSVKLFQSIIETFTYLPICSIINGTSLCLHGGLSPLLEKVDNIKRSIQRPISDFDSNPLLTDILWGDPSPDLEQHFSDNHRGRGKIFNGPSLINFLKKNNLKRLIRGHECVNGVKKLFNGKCITVFSASSYSFDMGNSSGILKISQKDDKIESIIFKPLHRLKKFDSNYFKVQPFQQKQSIKSIREYKSGFLSMGNFFGDQNVRKISRIKKHSSLNDTNKFIKSPANIRTSPSRLTVMKTGKRQIISRRNLLLTSENKPLILAPTVKTQNKSQFLFNDTNEICLDEKIDEIEKE